MGAFCSEARSQCATLMTMVLKIYRILLKKTKKTGQYLSHYPGNQDGEIICRTERILRVRQSKVYVGGVLWRYQDVQGPVQTGDIS